MLLLGKGQVVGQDHESGDRAVPAPPAGQVKASKWVAESACSPKHYWRSRPRSCPCVNRKFGENAY